MLPDAAALRRTYEKLSDDKLLRLATERAGTLRPEALTLLRQIVTERGLADAAMAAIDAQVQVLDDTTLLAYCEVLRVLPCPAELLRSKLAGRQPHPLAPSPWGEGGLALALTPSTWFFRTKS